jgi:hypothetical protein
VPFLQRVSNEQFRTELDKLVTSCNLDESGASSPEEVCRCGCGLVVGAGRLFVNHDHYNRSRGLPKPDAEQIVASFRSGTPKRQLARKYGLDRTSLKRLLRRYLTPDEMVRHYP